METRRRSTDWTEGEAQSRYGELEPDRAEAYFRAAASRRAEQRAIDARGAELEERERALAAREQLIHALEQRLEESRRRLEARIEQLKARRPAFAENAFIASFQLPTVHESYFDAGSYVDEQAWWSRQLGRPPRLVA